MAYSAPASIFHSKRFDFFFEINRTRIDANADREGGRFAGRVIAEIQSVVQLVHHVRQTNSVDVEHGRGIRVRPHLRRIARNQKQVMQA